MTKKTNNDFLKVTNKIMMQQINNSGCKRVRLQNNHAQIFIILWT